MTDVSFLLWVGFAVLVTSLFLLPILENAFREYGLVDRPSDFGLTRGPVPYGTGVFFVALLSLMVPVFLDMTPALVVVMVGGLVLTAVSFADDHWKLPVWPRLLTQLLVAGAVVLAGVTVPAISNPLGATIVLDGWTTTFSFFGQELTVAWLAASVATVWLLTMMNAINWLDGVPGMVSGMSTIMCAVLLTLTLQGFHVIDQSTLAVLAAVIGTSTLVFWFFDAFGPRVLMGDSGTMFLGFVLGVLAIYSGAKFATALIVLAFPVFDLFWTVGRRLIHGQRPWTGDFQHFHHELLKAGLSEAQVNCFYFLTAGLFGAATLFLDGLGKLMVLLLLFGLMVSVRLLLRKIGT